MLSFRPYLWQSDTYCISAKSGAKHSKIKTHTDLPFWARYDLLANFILSINGQRTLLSDSAYAQKRLIFGYSMMAINTNIECVYSPGADFCTGLSF